MTFAGVRTLFIIDLIKLPEEKDRQLQMGAS